MSGVGREQPDDVRLRDHAHELAFLREEYMAQVLGE